MRIGINARFLIPDKLEGIGWYSYQILKRMVEQHPEHDYFFFYDRKHENFLIQHPSVRHIVVAPPARHPVLWFFWFECSLPRALSIHKIDRMFHPDGYCSLHSAVPQMMVVHDLAYIHFPNLVPFLVRLYYQLFVPRQLQKARRLFAVSNATAADIQQHFPECSSKISIAFNGVRQTFRPLNEASQKEIQQRFSSGQPYFLFVGAIHPRKNVDGLIKAFHFFKEKSGSSMKLIIVGRRAWHYENFNRLVQSSPYQEDIIILDYMGSEELANITASAFAVVQPSFLEGFGVPVLEALYCDIPVIVSNRFSLPEVAGPGAYLFNPDKIEELSDQFILAIKDPRRSERIEMGRLHRTHFNWDQSAESIYQGIVS